MQIIGDRAFYGCSSLTSITIPESVTSIVDSAFYRCHKLVEVYNLSDLHIEQGSKDNGYVGYYALGVYTSLDVQSKVVAVEDYLFYDDNEEVYLLGYKGSSTELTLPKDYKGEDYDICQYAFYGCTSLTSVTIPEGVTIIGECAFSVCTELKTVTFARDSKLQIIGHGAFEHCTSLTSITIPESVTNIGYKAFSGCDNLQTVIIASGSKLQAIGVFAFEFCKSLTSITIPEGVTNIGDRAFCVCENLKEVHIGDIKSWLNINFESDFSNPLRYGAKLTLQGNELTELTIPQGITEIKRYAFFNCSSLTSVTIPESVTSIGESAFEYCENLKEVHISDTESWLNIDFEGGGANPLNNGAKLYVGDEEITELTIPQGITEIKQYAFYGLSSLTSVNIPDRVTSIGRYAFEDCWNLKEVHISDIESWIKIDFENDYSNPLSNRSKLYVGDEELTNITIPQGITEIKNYAFNGCSSLTSIVIPDSVTSIGDYAFDGCYKLVEVYDLSDLHIEQGSSSNGSVGSYARDIYTSLDEPSKIEEVEDYLFYDDNDMVYLLGYKGSSTELTLPKDYKGEDYEIYEFAFYGCVSLTNVTIPSSVTSIEKFAFWNCTNLTSITISDSVTSIGMYAFNGCENLKEVHISDTESWFKIDFADYNSNPLHNGAKLFLGDEELTELKIPQSITEIKEFAFEGYSSLTSVNIPNSVTSIGESSFLYCSNLQTVIFAKDSKLQSIGDYAFEGCSSLTSVVIPDSVTSIGDYAFDGCYKLVEVYNLSGLHIEQGSYNNGYVGYYALGVYTSLDAPSKIVKEEDYLFYDDNETVYLFGYKGNNTELTLPKDYKGKDYEINKYAFAYCSSLTSIVIPDSVTSIGGGAFYDCKSLTSVYYGGSSEQWSEIAIDSDIDYLTSVHRYYFSEEDPYVEGTAKDGEEYWHYGDDGMPQVWAMPNA